MQAACAGIVSQQKKELCFVVFVRGGIFMLYFFFKRGKINMDWAGVGWDERHLKEFGEEKGYDM